MKAYLSIIILITLIIISQSESQTQSQQQSQKFQCWQKNKCNFHYSHHNDQSKILDLYDEETLKIINENLSKKPNITYKEYMQQRKKYQEIQQKLTNIKIRQNQQQQEELKRRLLQSTNNQFKNIDQSNYYQVNDNNYIYSHRWPTLYIHKITGSNITLILQKNISDVYSYTQSMLVSNGYLAIIKQAYQPTFYITFVLTQIYKFNGTHLSFIRGFNKSGYLLGASQYNSQILIIIQQDMKNISNYKYQWSTTNALPIYPIIYQGQSANYSNNWLGNSARSIGKISLSNQSSYRFATYLFCDYANYFMLSNTLKIYVTGVYWDPDSYVSVTSVQRIFFNQQNNNPFGHNTRYAQLRGNSWHRYQMHEYNNYFSICLTYYNTNYTISFIEVTVIPAQQFTTEGANIYKNIQPQGNISDYFSGNKFHKDLVFILFSSGRIRTFSTSLGINTGLLLPPHDQHPLSLWLYGNKYLISFGYVSINYPYSYHPYPYPYPYPSYPYYGINALSIILYQIKNNKLYYHKSYILNNTLLFNRTRFSFYDKDLLLFDYQNKRIVFPITYFNRSAVQYPYYYIQGYAHIYIQPSTNSISINDCISTLPISINCSSLNTPQYKIIQIADKIHKHISLNQNYSEQIIRSSILKQNGQYILVTASYRVLQARMLRDARLVPVMLPGVSEEAKQVNIF